MSLPRLLSALVDRGHRGLRLDLEPTLRGARALGDPHERLAVVHVGGSNGKGSTSAMIERIARESGLRTGLTTSPHLVRFAERVAIDGAPIEDAAFEAALGRVFRDAPDDLTFFETLTLAALVAFVDAGVELAVLEVGLGGRLDATNVVPRPLATAITSITRGEGGAHLEHADRLGTTRAAVAGEKAGILKPGAPLALGPIDGEARDAILARASAVGAGPVWQVAPTWCELPADAGAARLEETAGGAVCTDPMGVRHPLAPQLVGRHQLENAAVAALAATLAARSSPALAAGVAAEAIARGVARAAWPGRFERLERPGGVTVWLDAAHNVDGARCVVEAAQAAGLDPARTHLVFGALADKAYVPMLRTLAPLATRRTYAEPGGRAPAPLDELVRLADGACEPDPVRAVLAAEAAAGPGGHVLVTGSIYLVGRVRGALLGIPPDPVMGL